MARRGSNDITRDVGDVTPNTFVAPGVVDRGLATAVSGVAEAGMALDAGLARERFDKAQAQLHAQYVVGSPAAGALNEDSFSDTTGLSPEDDRSLKDFKAVLDTQNNARDQGKMNFSSYQLRSERLLRIAIAKRPGLAQEFRSIASSYVGSDVTGAESQFLADAERSQAAEAAKAAKSDEDKRWKLYDDQIELFKKFNMGGFAGFSGPDDPGYQEWMAQNLPVLQQKMQAEATLQLSKQFNEQNEQTKTANLDSNTAVWVAEQEVLMGNAAGLADTYRTALKQQGAENDPMAARQVFTSMTQGMREAFAQSEADAQRKGIEPALRAQYRERMQQAIQRAESILAGKDDAEFMENANNFTLATSRNAMLKNEEYRTTATFFKDMPPAVQELLVGKLPKQMALMGAQMLQDTAVPETVARQAPALLPDMISVIFGGKGAKDPIATQRFVDIGSKALASYITQDDSAFRAAQFTNNPVTHTPGTVQLLVDHSGVIVPSLNPEQKKELTTTLAAAAGNSLRVLGIGLRSKYPTLNGKIKVDMDFPKGAAFVLKDGVKESDLTTIERQGLLAYNRAANAPLLVKALQAYGNVDPAGASKLVKESYQPGQALKATQTRSTARPAPSSGGSSPYADGTRLQGPDGVYVVRGGKPVKEE